MTNEENEIKPRMGRPPKRDRGVPKYPRTFYLPEDVWIELEAYPGGRQAFVSDMAAKWVKEKAEQC